MFRFIVVVCTLLVAGSAFAQTNTLAADNPRGTAKLRLGPFYVTPLISLEDMGIDTNVFNEQGNPKKDFFLVVTPNANVWLPIARRGLVKASVGTGLVYYKENASERSLDPRVNVRGEMYLRRFTFIGEGGLLYSRQRPSFEIDLRSRRLETLARGGLDMRLTPKTSLEVTGLRRTVEFDGDAIFLGTSLETTLNRETKGVDVVGRYHYTPLTRFSTRVQRFADDFRLSPIRNSQSVQVMAGVELQPRALVNGSAFVGYRQLTPDNSTALQDFRGLVAELELEYTVLGSTTFGLTHTRNIGYSVEPQQPYYVASSIGGRARRALGPRFDVAASIDRHLYHYKELLTPAVSTDPSAPTVPERRVDTTWNYGASLGYRVGRLGRIGFGLSYWRRESTTREFRQYDGLRFGTTATYGF